MMNIIRLKTFIAALLLLALSLPQIGMASGSLFTTLAGTAVSSTTQTGSGGSAVGTSVIVTQTTANAILATANAFSGPVTIKGSGSRATLLEFNNLNGAVISGVTAPGIAVFLGSTVNKSYITINNGASVNASYVNVFTGPINNGTAESNFMANGYLKPADFTSGSVTSQVNSITASSKQFSFEKYADSSTPTVLESWADGLNNPAPAHETLLQTGATQQQTTTATTQSTATSQTATSQSTTTTTAATTASKTVTTAVAAKPLISTAVSLISIAPAPPPKAASTTPSPNNAAPTDSKNASAGGSAAGSNGNNSANSNATGSDSASGAQTGDSNTGNVGQTGGNSPSIDASGIQQQQDWSQQQQ